MRFALPLTLAITCLAACQTVTPTTPEAGDATLIVSPRLAERQVLYTAAQINHLGVTIYRVSGATETAIASDDVQGTALVGAQVTFGKLKRNTTYRVKATAYGSAGTSQVISDPALSQVDITVSNDNAPTFAGVPVKLLNSGGTPTGIGASAGIQIVPGAYITPTPSARLITGLVSTVSTIGPLNGPVGLGFDPTGNLYVADTSNNRVVKLTPGGISSVITTSVKLPQDVVGDAAGNVYVADYNNNRILKIASNGVESSLGSGFKTPGGVSMFPNGDLLVADSGNNRICRLTTAGVVTQIAAGFNGPYGMDLDSAGNIYVADYDNNRIAKIDPGGNVSTFATGFNNPSSVALDQSGNIYVSDTWNHRIAKVTSGGVVSTFLGALGTADFADGMTTAARFHTPCGVRLAPDGTIYVADADNNKVRKVQ